MPLIIVRNDITRMAVDAIVNSANPHVRIGAGVDRAVHKAAGPELFEARKKIGDIAPGSAAITQAYQLKAKYVIHAVGPAWRDGNDYERELLASCYKNCLQLAADNGCSSIAMPLISTKVLGCPAEISIAIATQVIRDFLKEHEIDVYLVVFDQKSFKISDSLFEDVQSYLDDKYIEELLDEEYSGSFYRKFRRILSRPHHRDNDSEIDFSPDIAALEAPVPKKASSLEDRLSEIDDTFSQSLLRLIDSKGQTDPEVYKQANIDRKLFSKIRNNPAYRPSKTTALAFAIALKLNLDETRDLIGRAGFALSHSNKADIIVEYFIERQEYDIFTINDTLFAFGQPPLGC